MGKKIKRQPKSFLQQQHEEEEIYQVSPLKFTNKNNENEYYYGSFNNKGNFSGLGTLISKENNIYKGNFKNGIFNGKGIFIYNNGNYYYGNWMNGKCNGEGKLIIKDILEYKGNFKDNKREGNGN